ncbi:MAG: 2-isopropylmalate synthase [Candidatus Micrarchaeia archaeon]
MLKLRSPAQPNLLREIFPYTTPPLAFFDSKCVRMRLPKEIFITDTTFRDGQQAREPYSVEQIRTLYEMLSALGGKQGVIRQTEFFLYSRRDREAVAACMKAGLEYPRITAWIRAKEEDLQLVKEMGIKETGMLTSCSDYHIYLKLKLDRRRAFEKYCGVVESALTNDIIPRCHFEDVTRADIRGFVIPFARQLMDLSERYGMPVKIRLCDTLGVGLPYAEACLPRSIPKLIRCMTKDAHVPSEWLEWHGHDDFGKAHINAVTAWLYGCSAANGTLLGIGERTGNSDIESLCIEYACIKGEGHGMRLEMITEIARYFEKEIGVKIPPNRRFIGSEFNITRAGIHADGMLKGEEIYNAFDTRAVLGREPEVVITDRSGAAGIVLWLRKNIESLKNGEVSIDKNDEGVQQIRKWIEEQYENGRITPISREEMLMLASAHLPEIFK